MSEGETVEGSARRVAVSVADAARLMGAKPDTLRAKLRRGALPGYQDDSGAWWNYWHARGEANPGRLDGKDNDGNVCESWR